MSDNRKISEEYTEIGNELIQMMPLPEEPYKAESEEV